ncbi:MAG: radical SAM protein [bacterium]
MFISYKSVSIGSGCNFNCLFCGCEKKDSEKFTTEELKARLLAMPESENIEFTGGELFIRRDAAAIIKIAAQRFCSVKCNTNGVVFAYKKALDALCVCGLNNIYVKFFSTDPKIHAAITRTDTLKYVVEGFENLVSRHKQASDPFIDKWECGFFLATEIFIHSMTLPTLEETAKYISGKQIPRLIFDFNHSDCASDEAILTARRCIDESVGNGTWAVIKGLPACAMRGFEEHCGDAFRLDRFIPGNVFILGVCEKCVLFSTCGGVPASLEDKRKWTPITIESGMKNLDDIIHFHSHIPAKLPSIQSGARQ